MVGYVQSLERLGYPISEEFATDIILNSLPSAYGKFILNYHMHGMDKKLTELHGMLKQAEVDLKKGTSRWCRIRLSSRRVLGLRRRLSQEESRLRTRSQALPQGLSHLLQQDPLASIARRMAT